MKRSLLLVLGLVLISGVAFAGAYRHNMWPPCITYSGATGLDFSCTATFDNITIGGTCTGCGSGVTGPATSTNTGIPIWNGTNGDALLDSGLTYGGGVLNFPTTFTLSRAGASRITANTSGVTIGGALSGMSGLTTTGTGNIGTVISSTVRISTSSPFTCSAGERGALVNVDGGGQPGALCWCTDDGLGGFAYQKLNPDGVTACP